MSRRRIYRRITIIAGVLNLCACSPLPLSQAVLQFSEELNQAPFVSRVALSDLQQIDPLLLRPASLYPQLADAPLRALSAVYRYHQYCAGSLDDVPTAFAQFELALCRNSPLPVSWFSAHPISPLGGSNAWYYIKRYPDAKTTLEPFLHVRERPQALGGIGQLSDDNLDALINGQTWLIQDGDLWRQHQHQWLRYAPQTWQSLAQKHGIMLTTYSEQCDMPLGTLCVSQRNNDASWWRLLLGTVAMLSALTLGWSAWQRRRMLQRQRFIVQMLTHELRTPIAQLGNVVEYFRRDFDNLSPEAQYGFGALADSVQRMRKMADASRHYLNSGSDHVILETPSTIRLSEWLMHIVQPYPELFFCIETDRQVALQLYWTTLCLNNLLDNAFYHGRAPVRLYVSWHKGKLSLSVSDSGQFTVSRSPRAGMGLGLIIVERVMRRLNGRLLKSGPPTTYTLELPCENQT